MEEKKALYENSFVPTEKEIGDYVVHLIQKRTSFSILITSLVMMALFALWWTLGAIGVINNMMLHLVAALILLLTIMATDSFLKHYEFRRLAKKFSRQNKDEMDGVKTLFYEDKIDSNGKLYDYAEFTKVAYGDSCMFLISEKGKVLMIKDDPAAFGQENSEPFWEFLKSKCSLKAPKKKSNSPLSFRSNL